MQKRLLLIAFHFPPIRASTGIHRALGFARYLGRDNWDVAVLTARPGAYPDESTDTNSLIPAGVRVIRSLALDAKRHFSVFGRYPAALATPDRWRSWIWTGYLAGRHLLRDWRPHAIMSTFPIASAHEIALRLSRASGLPWVADFRDPMAQEDYPDDHRIRRAYWQLEERVLKQCSAVTVTTSGTAELYRSRYSAFPPGRIRVIANGFAEQSFPVMESTLPRRHSQYGPVTFLHSGILYPSERDPEGFFRAISDLRHAGLLGPDVARFHLRGAGNTDQYQERIKALRIEDMVRLLPSLPYQDALREMHESDVLMLFQASNCNLQIPAKLYEYLYVGRPIIGLTDPNGDTGRLLAELGIQYVAGLDDVASIKSLILRTVSASKEGALFVPRRDTVMRFSRQGTATQLALLLNELTENAAGVCPSGQPL